MTASVARAAAVLAVLATAAPPLPGLAVAALPGACPDADGVTVVVDFQELGGSTIVSCAPGPQSTGLAALKDAGISITGTTRWGEAFICRIEGKPGPDAESCVDTPPATAYWSYWHAPNGGSWIYSQQGATYRTPPPGSFEGWSFALDRTTTAIPPPGVDPQRPPPPPPQQPETEPDQPSGEDPPTDEDPPAGGSGSEPGGAGPPGVDRPTIPPSTPPTPAGEPTGTATVAPGSTSPATPSEVDNVAARSSQRAPVGTLLGVGLLLALVAVAAVTAWRRRLASRD